MKVKKVTTVKVSLVFDLKELQALYHKLVVYCKFDPTLLKGKAPTDEVEHFLIDLCDSVIISLSTHDHGTINT